MKRKTRYYHYAIICPYPKIGQVGCTRGRSKAEAQSHLEDKGDRVKLMPARQCPVCKEFDQ